MVNTGKKFEKAIKDSVPDYCILIRIPDPPQSFVKSESTRFSHKNICDFVLFDTVNRVFYLIELKTTKLKSISFEDINLSEQNSKMIHKHQIIGLTNHTIYNNTVPCFMFNFRNEETNEQRTYFQNINDFNNMTKNINKKSFDEMDLLLNNAIKITGNKKRTNYIWDLESLFEQISQNFV